MISFLIFFLFEAFLIIRPALSSKEVNSAADININLGATCTVKDNCVTANSVGVIGSPPNCTCICKPGWINSNCSVNSVIPNCTNNGYISEYWVLSSIVANFSDAIDKCRSLGEGWDIATIASVSGNDAISKMCKGLVGIWLGGRVDSDLKTWRWISGRLRNKIFTTKKDPYGANCSPGFYCKWQHNSPNNWQGCHFDETALVMRFTDGFNKEWDDFNNRTLVCLDVSNSVACERSYCSPLLDCNENGTFFSPGFFPNCTCVCFPGWSGNKCENKIFLPNSTQNGYTSEFTILCKNISSYSVALSACQKFLNGWDIATVPSASANAAIKTIMTNKDAWLGGINAVGTNSWMWTSGRLRNMYFWNGSSIFNENALSYSDNSTCNPAMYCNWDSLQPSTTKCGSSVQNVLAIQQSDKWRSTIANNDPQCSTIPSCVICERSACVLSVDCKYPDRAFGVTGYYPLCSCDCKLDWDGDNCEDATYLPTATYKGYTSQYISSCTKVNSYESAVKRCQLSGDGWDIATIPSHKANAAATYYTNDAIFYGATDKNLSGTWTWQAGRLKGQAFWRNGPLSGMFSYWGPGFPRNIQCGGQTEHYLARKAVIWVWNSVFEHYSGSGCSAVPSCTACERSFCNLNLDCKKANTAGVEGYYPNCTCECMPGYSGPKCDSATLLPNSTQNNYTSVFAVVCSNISSYAEAVNRCRFFKQGWDIATVPSVDANAAIRSLLTSSTWLAGGISSFNKSNWIWSSGRLKNKYFWSTSSSLGTCINGSYCNWGANEPNTTKCGSKSRSVLAMQITGEWRTTIDSNNETCADVPTCVACERSSCNAVIDCNAEGTFKYTGYYPNCSCECLPGWNGFTCNQTYPLINITINNTISEYFSKCYSFQLSQGYAEDVCKDYLNGWDIATVPSADANNAISIILPIENNYGSAWLGGSDEGHEGVWKWIAGRLKNMTYTPANALPGGVAKCEPGMYCNWQRGTPSNWQCKPGANENGMAIYRRVTPNVIFNYTWDDITRDWQCYDVPYCTICERSPCVLKDITCNTNNTKKISGYYPDCKCVCNVGFGGPTCDDRVCDISINCNDNAVSVNGTYPDCICYCKPGWTGVKCEVRVCDIVTECNNNAVSVNGTYPHCTCQCKPGWSGNTCDARVCDINIDCDPNNTISVEGTYPNCQCQCKPKWGGSTCSTRVCDLSFDCNNKGISVNGTYPNCQCTCKPHYHPPNCSSSSMTKSINPSDITTTNIFSTTSVTTFSPGLPTCPFDGIYPCTEVYSHPEVQKGYELWPASLDLSALLSTGKASIVLPVLKGMPFNITANDTRLMARSVTDGGGKDVPYRRIDGAAFIIESVSKLSDRLHLRFSEASPGSSTAPKIPNRLFLRFMSDFLFYNCCNSSLKLLYLAQFDSNNKVSIIALDVGNISVVAIPNKPLDQRAISQDSWAVIDSYTYAEKSSCKGPLLGSSWVELTAAAPLGRLLPMGSPYYVRALAAHFIVIVIVTIVHGFIVVILSKRSSYKSHTFGEWCGKARFPSVTIGCIVALSPGTAISTSELFGNWSGCETFGAMAYPAGSDLTARIVAIVGLLLLLGTLILFFYPLFSMKRILVQVNLKPNAQRCQVERLFPTTIVLPLPMGDMFHSIVGAISRKRYFWIFVPLWSSIVLFICTLILHFTKLSEAVPLIASFVLHFIIIVAVMVFRPFYALSLNFFFSFALIPIALLSLIRGMLIIQEIDTAGNGAIVASCFLVTFVAFTRLLMYILQCLRCFTLTSPKDIACSVWSDGPLNANTDSEVNLAKALKGQTSTDELLLLSNPEEENSNFTRTSADTFDDFSPNYDDNENEI